MSIDPRLIERRHTVAEDNAKKSMTRLLKFLLLAVFICSIVWFAFSPWLSIARVETDGVEASATNTILADMGVRAGAPMILVDTAATEMRLLADPWVAEASVARNWPHLVTVTVTERVPLAWVETQGGWSRRALDGYPLPSAEQPGDDLAHVEMSWLGDDEAITSGVLRGALEFVDGLPQRLRSGVEVTVIDGEIWATVDGYQTRLGRPVEMREKALSLEALLGQRIPKGSVLVLIAPTNPAVMTPGAGEEAAGGADAEAGSDQAGATDEGDASAQANPEPQVED